MLLDTFCTMAKSAAVKTSACALVAGALFSAAPARAFDDQPGTFAPILGAVGFGGDKNDDNIDFRERPPLVVPKSVELPPPRPGASNSRPANWPQDQDIVRRKDEAARARRPEPIQPNKNPALTQRELMEGRTDAPPVAVHLCDASVDGVPDCAQTPMAKLKQVFTGGPAPTDVVIVGKEPDREYLTEPPKGYRRATQTVAATREKGYEKPDYGDAGKYIREEAKRTHDADQ